MAPLAQIEHRGLAIWVLQMWPTLRASEVAGATNHRKTNTFKKHKFRILSGSIMFTRDSHRIACSKLGPGTPLVHDTCHKFSLTKNIRILLSFLGFRVSLRDVSYAPGARSGFTVYPSKQIYYFVLYKVSCTCKFRGQFGATYTPLAEIYTHSYNTQLWGNPKHTKKPGHKIPKM